MYILYSLTFVAVLISFLMDRQKTKKAIFVGVKKLWKIAPPFITILIAVSVVLYFVPNKMIVHYLGGTESFGGMIIASLVGTITVMPGPISYPLCGILLSKGVSYSVIAAFSSSLMLVGVLTFPLERAYFGYKFAIWRNIISFFIALIIAFVFMFVSGWLI